MFNARVGLDRRHNLTLAVMLVVFVCQFFPNCLAVAFEYSGDTHPLGQDINHIHSDHSSVIHVVTDATSDNWTTSELVEHARSEGALLEHEVSEFEYLEHEGLEHESSDHEHSSHGHSFCHPPAEYGTAANDFRATTIASATSLYQALRYAPPIPPPSV